PGASICRPFWGDADRLLRPPWATHVRLLRTCRAQTRLVRLSPRMCGNRVRVATGSALRGTNLPCGRLDLACGGGWPHRATRRGGDPLVPLPTLDGVVLDARPGGLGLCTVFARGCPLGVRSSRTSLRRRSRRGKPTARKLGRCACPSDRAPFAP